MRSTAVILLMVTGLVFGAIDLETSPCWSSPAIPQGSSLWGTFFADLTGDGYPEVIIMGEQIPWYVFSNDSGVISTEPAYQQNGTDLSIWASFGDYDNDGDLDMAVANYYLLGGSTKVYQNDNGVLTRDPVWIASIGGGNWCEWGDMDNDGDLDLVISDLFANPMAFRNNNGELEQSPFWTGNYNIDFGGSWIDVDCDGDLDLVISGNNWQEPVHRLYYNNNGSLETTASWASTLDGNYYMGAIDAAGDIDKDGWPDLAAPMGMFTDNNNNAVYKNISGALEQTPSWFSSDGRPSTSCVLGDINGDGYLDWAVNNQEQVSVVYENMGGTLSGTPAWLSSTNGGLGIDLGDIDKDGVVYKEDTVIANGLKKLFYLSAMPVHKFVGVTIDGDSVPVRLYCYSPRSGWVSMRDSIAAGSQVVFKYYHSTDLELLQSDYFAGQAHIFKNNVGIAEHVSKPVDIGFSVFPNPVVNSDLQFSYTINDPGLVSASIYDASGRKKAELFNKTMPAGFYKEKIPLSLVPGVYFLRLETKHTSAVEKIVYVR